MSVAAAAADLMFARAKAKCSECGHYATAHTDGTGACSMRNCECGEFSEAAATVEALAEGDPMMPPEHMPDTSAPTPDPGPAAPSAVVQVAEQRWHAILAPEGKATDDGRIFAPDSISWRELPLTLMGLVETSAMGGHDKAEICGRIDMIAREPVERMSLIVGEGIFDSGEFGTEIARLVGDETLRGNSVDLAIREFEFGPKSDYVDEDGYWIGPDEPQESDVDILDLLFGDTEDLIFVIRDAVIGMSTVCPFPAFEEGTISLVSAGERHVRFRVEADHTALLMRVYGDGTMQLFVDDSLTASAAGLVPEVPPAAWFDLEEPDELTPLTITDEGQVYGHAWAWGSCHTSFQDRCTVAPHSKTNYSLFHLKEIEVDSGERVPCGTITLDAPHAEHRLSLKEAASHYDHTGAAVADVRVSDGEHGGWVCGALRPDCSASTVRKLRGAVLSGDWRRWEGNLELIGLLGVNIPGFAVPRGPYALVASGTDELEVQTLISAGVRHGTVSDRNRARFVALGARADGGLAALAALAARGAIAEDNDCGCAS